MQEKSVLGFLDELASSAPTPGGGSAAAVMGAMGAALLSMACNLTVGKRDYSDVEAEMREALAKAENLRDRFQQMIRADIEVFDAVMAAYRMPRESDDEKTNRDESIQLALKEATLVPLECAKACSEVIALSRVVAEKGNKNVVSDAGVGVAAAFAALRSAALNVYINTGQIKDEVFAATQLEALERILEESGRDNETVYAHVVRLLQ